MAMQIVQMWMDDFYAPCVYVWRRNEEWLYVGMSRNGLARIGTGHHLLSATACRPNDELLVFRPSGGDIAAVEKKLIDANQPRYNKRGRDDSLILGPMPRGLVTVGREGDELLERIDTNHRMREMRKVEI